MKNLKFIIATSISLVIMIALLSAFKNAMERPGAGVGENDEKAVEVIEKVIGQHGGELYKVSSFEFDFRGKHFKREFDNGTFRYTRSFYDSSRVTPELIEDVLTNDGFNRFVNGRKVGLTPKYENAFRQSVNSVIYFTSLPFGLKDPAVNMELTDKVEIKGKEYFKVRVTFDQNGGGDDFQDVFFYWINADTYTLDYLAYEYNVDGGGIRFREAINRQNINGIVFQDYINYEVNPGKDALQNSDRLFEKGQLRELSRIINENIRVYPESVTN